jgi:serine beta-lactamase-like protein LACTB
VANSVVSRIADDSLRLLQAAKDGKPLPKIEIPERLTAIESRLLPGLYRSGEKFLQLSESAGRLWVLPGRGGFRVELKRLNDSLIADDLTGYGTRAEIDPDGLRIGKDLYVRSPSPKPAAFESDLIGEYGWDHNILYVFEWERKLYCNIEWFFVYPLKEEKKDVYAFPDFGLYHGEKIIFKRDAKGKVIAAEAASVTFKRRKIDGENGETFRIQPLKPVAELTEAALKASPPVEKGEFVKSNLVDLSKLDPTIKFDLRYATDNNFLSTPLYPKIARAYLQKPAAESLLRVHQRLKQDGYGLLIFDAYRPWYVTKIFYDATPEKFRNFVADPKQGSRHNRGCAVDLGLYELSSGKVIEMVGGFDEFADRVFPDYLGGTSLQRWHRDLLRKRMESEGFTVYPEEWWHFDYREWRKYPIGNQKFEELGQ